jgi:hypothetical protein
LIVTNSDGEAFTYGNLFENKDVTISLSNEWDMDRRQGTALHETMHALGYHHEHSRNDRDHFLTVKIGKDHNNDIIESSFSITRFDPFSVMMYGE